MRELQVWEVGDGLNQMYDDIVQLSKKCRFKDCLHSSEPDCAVNGAILSGILDSERISNFNKMQKEAANLSLKMLGNINTVEKIKGTKYAQILKNDNRHKNNRKRKKRNR
jgi:ribosome biogenesis GTPase / thiamine phosphate phosphatase